MIAERGELEQTLGVASPLLATQNGQRVSKILI